MEDVGNLTHQTFLPNLTTLVATVATKTEMLPNVSSAQLVSSAAASLSPSILAHGSRVATTIFTHDTLFQQRPNFTRVREEETKQVGSVIMQVTIVGSSVTGKSIDDPAIYTFTQTEVYVCMTVCVSSPTFSYINCLHDATITPMLHVVVCKKAWGTSSLPNVELYTRW